eukprot:1180608-Prorocentrum_minimum.AAC.1
MAKFTRGQGWAGLVWTVRGSWGTGTYDGEVHEGVEEGVGEEVGLEAELKEGGVLGIVVMLLLLPPGVGHVDHLKRGTHE